MTTYTVNINKVDVGGTEVVGARLELSGKDKDGNVIIFKQGDLTVGKDGQLINGVGETLVWISGSEASIIVIEDGTYTLHEEAAPNGYLTASDITFEVNDGRVTVNGKEVTEIIMVDEKQPVTTTSTTTTETTSTTTTTETSTETEISTTHTGKVLPDEDTRTTTTRTGGIGDDYDTRTKTSSTTTSTTEETTTETTTTHVADIHISKEDIYGTEVVGAVLTLTGQDEDGNNIRFSKDDVSFGADASFIGDGTQLKWISGSESTFIRNLPDGTYLLHENAAPDGYETATDIIFTIADGKLAGNESDTVVMIDRRVGEVEISKQNVYGDEISGAELTLTGRDADGNEITFDIESVIPGKGAELITTESGTEIIWKSGSSPTFVKNLPDGTYVLHEIAAPNGYEVTTDIEFTVYNGEISGETGVEGNSITMIDNMIKTDITISKEDVLGNELAGAELTLTGKDLTGRDVEFSADDVNFGTGAEFVSDGKQLTWISGSGETLVKNLPDGTYVLHETAAPSGYKVTTDIEFIIENGEVKGDSHVDSSSVTMVDDMYTADVEISKEDVFGKELAGATLTLTGTDSQGRAVVFSAENVVFGKDAKFVSDGNELRWVSGSEAAIVKNLPDGTYVLHEIAAPNGYTVATDITFTIVNGELKGSVGVESNSVTMTDDMIRTDVNISKENVFGKEIAGATLTLNGTDFRGNKVQFSETDVKLGEGAKFVSDGDALTWVSGTSETLVKNLPDGTYVLHEVAAPNGYAVATDITFTIENGELKGSVGVESDSVTMVDETNKTDIYLSKQDTTGNELAGAELTLTGKDFDGNEVVFAEKDVLFGEGAKLISDGKSLVWVSGTTPTLVKNLPDGTYVLHEIAAPNGYTVATDITFTVKDGIVSGNVGVSGTTVTMLDEAIVQATTESTVSTTTTTATSKKTTAKTTKTTAKTTTSKADAPKTGDVGVAIPVLALAMAAGAAFAFRKKREND